MSGQFSEDVLVQQTTTDFLQAEMGWETASAFDNATNQTLEILGKDGTFGRLNFREVVLIRFLDQAIRRFNPDLPDAVYRQAIDNLSRFSTAQTLVQINREKYYFFLDGIPISYRDEDGSEKSVRLRIFDFENPSNNHFLAIRELWIQGDHGLRRPDILGFVNGVPLLFVECKNTHKNLKTAYNVNLETYKAYIPHIFHHNAFVILTNGIEGRVGSITSPYGYFNEWKRLKEEDEDSLDIVTMLRGICAKNRFMDLFENFLLFDDTTGETRKILALNHQYLGVNRAFDAARSRKVRKGKLGVFWHTQGSGKSYSMVFLSRKIHRKLPGDFTFLVLTDREELDTQIYKTFVGVGSVNEKDECRATSGSHLRDLMQEDQRYVFSLIHKFNQEDYEPYTLRSNVIVISDEAHRTQYGLFARNMRYALPNASYIGFTGTPLIGGPDDELTKATFGGYISTYDFLRAVIDGATVPLYYDNRGEKLGITTEDLNEKMADILERYDPDEDQEARLRRVLSSDYLIITKPERLERVAEDFVAHYTQRWKTGKAMLLCVDKITAVKMHNYIDFFWQKKLKEQKKFMLEVQSEQEEVEQKQFLKWLEETERLVVISEAVDEVHIFNQWGEEILPHRSIIKSRDLDTEYKKDTHPFRVAVVCAMWLTGFDVESLATLYIDKPMKSHTLMQAIARANRVYEGKSNGLIVDYNGLLRALRKALATYASGRGVEPPGRVIDPVKPEDELLKVYAADIQACVDHLNSLGYDLYDLIEAEGFDKNEQILFAAESVSLNDTTKAKYEVLAQEVFKKAKSLVSHKGLYQYREQHDAIEAIYKRLKMSEDDPADIIEILIDLQGIVDEAIKVEKPIHEPGSASGKIYDMSSINFNRLRKEFKHTKRQNTAVQSIKQKVEQKLNLMIRQNPLRIDFYKHFQQIIEDYNKETDRATIEKTFEELLDFVESLSEEELRATREGLSEEHLAAFDLLTQKKDELKPAARERIKQISRELVEAIKDEIAKMDNWREKDSTQAQVQTFIYDYLYSEATGLPIEEYSNDEVEELAQELFSFVYQQYPSATDTIYTVSLY